MDGLPFGRGGDVFENTISGSPGTRSVAGSRKFVRSNAGADAGLRADSTLTWVYGGDTVSDHPHVVLDERTMAVVSWTGP